jgi:hypothetical protein
MGLCGHSISPVTGNQRFRVVADTHAKYLWQMQISHFVILVKRLCWGGASARTSHSCCLVLDQHWCVVQFFLTAPALLAVPFTQLQILKLMTSVSVLALRQIRGHSLNCLAMRDHLLTPQHLRDLLQTVLGLTSQLQLHAK